MGGNRQLCTGLLFLFFIWIVNTNFSAQNGVLEDTDLVEMGVSNEKEREQLLAAAKGLAARVMTAYLPPPAVSTDTPTHNNNNEGDKDSCQSDNLAQVRHCSLSLHLEIHFLREHFEIIYLVLIFFSDTPCSAPDRYCLLMKPCKLIKQVENKIIDHVFNTLATTIITIINSYRLASQVCSN